MELKHNPKFQAYVQEVCSQIKFKEVHTEIQIELECHVSEIAEEYTQQGFSEEEAVNKAINRMGDPESVGLDLNKVHQAKPEWGIIGLTGLLAGVGFLVTAILGLETQNLVFVLGGIGIAGLLYFIDYRKLKAYSKHIFAGVCLVMFLAVLTGLQGSAGSRITSNLAEFAPLLLIISLAGFMGDWKWNRTDSFLMAMGILILPLVLIMMMPRSSVVAPLVIYIVGFSLTMFLSGAKIWHLALPVVVGGASLSFFMLSAPYRLRRLITFLNPAQDPIGEGWILIRMEEMRSAAGLFGLGITRPEWIPFINEYLLTNVIYSFGWLVGIALIVAAAVFVIRLVGIGLKVRDRYGKLLVCNISAIFTVRFLGNILMNLGLAPTIGIEMPFFSLGGVDFFVNMALIGLVLSIYRRRSLKDLVIETE